MVVAIGCFLEPVVLGLLSIQFGGIEDFEPLGISTASRAISAILAVIITSIALTLPLMANLDTPWLVKLCVTPPVLADGLSILIISQQLLMSLCL